MVMSGPSGRGHVFESTIAMIFSSADWVAGDKVGNRRVIIPDKISFSSKIRDIFTRKIGVESFSVRLLLKKINSEAEKYYAKESQLALFILMKIILHC